MTDSETDTIEAFQTYIGDKKFSSFQEFEEQFKIFQKETGSVFRIKSSSSIVHENRRRKTPIPEHFKYGTISYCCVHFGQPKFKGHGVRPKQRYLPCGCEVVISISYSSSFLVVTKFNVRHNHTVHPDTAPFYASKRRLEGKEIEDIHEILTLNPGTKELKDYVSSKYHKIATFKDIHNLKSKLKAKSEKPATMDPKTKAFSGNDNVEKEKASSVNDNVGEEKASSVNDNVGEEKASSVNDNVGEEKASSVNDNVGEEKASSVNDNVGEEKASSVNDNVGEEKASSVNDNVEKEKASSVNDNVEKEKASIGNDNVEKEKASIGNDNVGKEKATKRGKKMMSLVQKIEVLDKLASGMTVSVVGRLFGVNVSTVRSIRKREKDIRESVSKSAPISAKVSQIVHDKVLVKTENDLNLWIQDMSQRNLPVDQNSIREKAKSLYDNIRESVAEPGTLSATESSPQKSFNASRGWFDKFKNRYALHNVKLTREADDHVSAEAYPIESLELIGENGYKHEQVFNADKTAMCWKRMPTRTYISKGEERASGFKASKEQCVEEGFDDVDESEVQPLVVCGGQELNENDCSEVVKSKEEQEEVEKDKDTWTLHKLPELLRTAKTLTDMMLKYDPSVERSTKVKRVIETGLTPYTEMYEDMQAKKKRLSITECS